MKHTELPWDYIVSRTLIHIETANKGDGSPCGRHICSVNKEDEPNAEFIVRAANSHYDLLEALKDLVGKYEDFTGLRQSPSILKAKAAIARAEGESSGGSDA